MIIITMDCKRSEKTGEVFNEAFIEHKKAFTSIEKPIIIDSTELSILRKKYKNLKLIPDSNEFIQEQVFQEMCEEVLKFDTYAYKIFEISEGTVGLLYFLKLNPECVLDAYVYRIILVVRNNQGQLIDYKEVVLLDEIWEISKYKYCTISNTNELTIESIEIVEDFDLNTRSFLDTLNKFVITKEGFIEE